MVRQFARPTAIAIIVGALAGLAAVFAAGAANNFSGLRTSDPACQPGGAVMRRLELVFGAGLRGGGVVDDAQWSAFLDAEITPRFPDGLTVLTGFGQWRESTGIIVKEPTRMLLIWHAPNVANEAATDAIRAAYKRRFAQESVLRSDGQSCVRF